MLIGLLFCRASFRPCDVTVKRMVPLEGTSWGAMNLLHERLLDIVGAMWLPQVATATPNCLYGGLSSSLPTTHPPLSYPTHPILSWKK